MSLVPPLAAPNLADYQSFITNVMGINSTILPTSSPVIGFSLAIALDIVNQDLIAVSPDMYALAVYNLAGDRLLNFAQDQSGAPNVAGSNPPAPFFAAARAAYGLNSFVAGIVESAGDEGTNESLRINDRQQFTLMDLQNLKTPYGRNYLQIAQSTGTLWGVN